MNETMATLEEARILAIKCCRICQKEKDISFFVKSRAFKDGVDTICLDCSREKVRLWRKSGKRDCVRERNSALLKNKEKVLLNERARTLKSYNKLKQKTRVLKTVAELKATKNRNEQKRRAAKRAAKWDKELTDLVLHEAYLLADLRKNITGFDWHVDHIVPLCGKIVSGLHVWNNIQVIPAIDNLRKNNYYAGE